MNDFTEYQKEEMRAAAEITKGVVSNPNVKISMCNETLMFAVGDQNRNIALIYKNAIESIRHGRE